MIAHVLNMLVSLWSVTFLGYPIPPTVFGARERPANQITVPLFYWERGRLIHFWQRRR